MTTITFSRLYNNGIGNVPLVSGFASTAAIGVFGHGVVPRVSGAANQASYVPNSLPPASAYDKTPLVRGIALALSGTAALGKVPLVTGVATQAVAGLGKAPLVRGVAGTLTGNIGLATLPAVYGFGTTLAQPKPSISAAYSGAPLMMGSATATVGINANATTDAVPTVTGRASTFARPLAVGAVPRVSSPSSYATSPPKYSASLLMSPGYMAIRSLVAGYIQPLSDTVAFSSSPSAQIVLQLLDAIAFGDASATTINLHALIAVSLAFGDALTGGLNGKVSDTVQFTGNVVELAIFIATLLDSFSVSSTLTGTAALFAFVSDSLQLSDSLSVKQQILQALVDSLQFGMTLFTGQDTYTAWVMTPETRAMRSYSNYAFNSYAHIGGRLYGATDAGVYLLEGDTDAGQSIIAKARTGLLDFGSRQLKSVDHAYLGYTAAGALALRVTTTSPDGAKVDYTYRMVQPAQAGAPRETRIVVGRGLKSVYWAFELDNSLDGKDFTLYDVTVLPIFLSRKVR